MAHDAVMQVGNVIGFWPEHDRLRGNGITQQDVKKAWGDHPPAGVTLVLWTDEAMQHLKDQGLVDTIWPIDYAAHVEALYWAQSLGAKAIFLDFVFPTKREDSSWDDLAKELLGFKKTKTPLFIACDSESPDPPAFEEFLNVVQQVNKDSITPIISFVPSSLPREPVIRNYDLITKLNPKALDGKIDGPGSATNMITCGANQIVPSESGSAERYAMTAASALFQAAEPDRMRTITEDTPAISIFWDRRTHAVTQEVFPKEREATTSLWETVKQWLCGVFIDPKHLERPRSGPPMIPAQFLVDPEPVSENPSTITIDDLIKDRVVIIGSAQISAADVRNTPNASTRPGALVHAVALDNLYKFGFDYVRVQDNVLGFNKHYGLLIFTIVIISSIYSVWIEPKHISSSNFPFAYVTLVEFKVRFLKSFALGVIGLLVSGYILIYNRIPPEHWFSTLLSFTFVSAPLVLTTTSNLICCRMYEDWHKYRKTIMPDF